MGGKGSGRKRKFRDQFHRVMRNRQQIYDREIARIAKENKCSLPEARKIRNQRKKQTK